MCARLLRIVSMNKIRRLKNTFIVIIKCGDGIVSSVLGVSDTGHKMSWRLACNSRTVGGRLGSDFSFISSRLLETCFQPYHEVWGWISFFGFGCLGHRT